MAEHFISSVDRVLSFDHFQILPGQRLLLEAGKSVRIGSRAFDLLVTLLERPGERVTKAELLARVWPDTHVGEGNLKFQVAALRRVLHDGKEGRRFIDTSQGQGYSFVTPIRVTDRSERPELPVSVAAPRQNLPQQLPPLFGRTEAIARLAEQLKSRGLVTIVGAGGIGKTSVALAVAERLVGTCEDGVWVVDLARITDPNLVRSAAAGAVGIEVGPELTIPNLVAALRNKRMLLVLDNCAHVIDAAAALVSALLEGASKIHILATSREPLRTRGEHLFRLAPLEVPPPTPRLAAAEALRFPSVQLFVDQAAASLNGFHFDDDDAPNVACICRKLDGIPLAIELAAARVGVLGISGLATQLDDRLRVLTGGRRTALPHHRTLRATLDWSYDLLNASEQTVLNRLAIFVGWFTLDAAATVASDASHPEDEVVQLVLELAAKSLVVADVDSPKPCFRLLDTTRAYALEKAKERGELEGLARRHAVYCLALLEAGVCDGMEFDSKTIAVAREVDNLRAALSWAFGPSGDSVIGVGLAAASVPVWLSTSLVGEGHIWVEKAIRSLDEAGLRNTRQEMVLQAALGISFQLVRAVTSEAHAALTRALELADHLGDPAYQRQIIHTFWIYHMRIGEVRSALALARRAEAIASSITDTTASAEAAWMLGIALYFAGESEVARQHLEHLLQDPPPGYRSFSIRRTGFDQYITARYFLGHALWIQGRPAQAMEAIRTSLGEARHLQHPLTLCSALGLGGCPLALRTGDLETAWRLAEELVSCAEQHALGDHLSYGMALQEIVSLRKAGSQASIEQARVALQRWRAAQWHVILSMIDFAEAAAHAGHVGEISALADEALERAERNQELWAYPEALRVKGELLLLQDAPDPQLAKQYFLRSLKQARGQGALSWELRTAMSIARLELRLRSPDQAREFLSRVYAQFKEGFDTADLKAAEQLLGKLSYMELQ